MRPFNSAHAFIASLIIAVLGHAPVVAAEQTTQTTEEVAPSNALVIQADFAGLVMTGVAYSVSRDLEIFNVRPLIPLYDIAAASESLEYNAQTWPSGTVFVSVVDPGVGTQRKSVVLQTKTGLFFVSPDNGSLSGPASAYGIEAVREIDESVNRIPGSQWAHTFHGRDVYSFTGARLAAGVISFAEVGPLLAPKVLELASVPGTFENGVLRGFVAGGDDRLGNIYFNIDRDLFAKTKASSGQSFSVTIRHLDEVVWHDVLPYARSFGSVPVGANLIFMNSSGALSLAINQGNFAEQFGIEAGVDWTVEIKRR